MPLGTVYLAQDTKYFLAAETSPGVRRVVSINGTPNQPTGLKYAAGDPGLTPVMLDLISGEWFAGVTQAQASTFADGEVFEGAGAVSGLFVPLPDFEASDEDDDPGDVVDGEQGEQPQLNGNHTADGPTAHRMRAATRRTAPPKKAAKKSPARRNA
jgi:hypothetical protein